MGFFKRLIGNEPIKTELIGIYNNRVKIRSNIEEESKSLETKIYLHYYRGNSCRIQIRSERKPVAPEILSYFTSSLVPTIENITLDLQTYPKFLEGDITSYLLADLNKSIFDINLIMSTKIGLAELIFSTQDFYKYENI